MSVEAARLGVLFVLEASRASWLHDIRPPVVDRRYDVCQRLMKGQNTLEELKSLSREELNALLDGNSDG
jgi:hypothetical protein